MYDVSAQGVDERMTNVHYCCYYYCYCYYYYYYQKLHHSHPDYTHADMHTIRCHRSAPHGVPRPVEGPAPRRKVLSWLLHLDRHIHEHYKTFSFAIGLVHAGCQSTRCTHTHARTRTRTHTQTHTHAHAHTHTNTHTYTLITHTYARTHTFFIYFMTRSDNLMVCKHWRLAELVQSSYH